MSRAKKLLAALPPLAIPDPPVYLQEFTLFPKLPENLRHHIWSFVASEPRKIKLIELDRRYPPSSQTWDSSIAGQLKNPGMVGACQESRKLASRYYRRCYEKAQRSPEDGDREWRGTRAELKQAKTDSMTSDGTAIYVNFSQDIFVLTKCRTIDHELRSEHFTDYNFKPKYLQYVQRIQQTYNEKKGMAFPLLLFFIARIWNYGLEMDEFSKEVVGTLSGVDRELHSAGVKYDVMKGLLHFMPYLPDKVNMGKWNVELR
ncbi:hypothetical protein IFR05_014910 [Cadophora sp. M221]|nr:hypothetical protein IFR05_014910 [Cadophora sp. M221]